MALSGRGAVAQIAPDDCQPFLSAAEQRGKLPSRLLTAIALVESGRRDPASGTVAPWPWTINVAGVGHMYLSKADAIAAVQVFQAQGVRSIDVGCMQVNLQYHPTAFASLDEAFDPAANVAYGARFLGVLHQQFDSWPQAIAAYHSQTPDLGLAYANRVRAIWPLGLKLFPDPTTRASGAALARPDLLIDEDQFRGPALETALRQAARDHALLDARFGARAADRAGNSPRRALLTASRDP